MKNSIRLLEKMDLLKNEKSYLQKGNRNETKNNKRLGGNL